MPQHQHGYAESGDESEYGDPASRSDPVLGVDYEHEDKKTGGQDAEDRYEPGTNRADVAREIGGPKATRAVGGANHVNPVPIIVPCHRVVAARGKLGGFACGLDYKRLLLDVEQMAATI